MWCLQRGKKQTLVNEEETPWCVFISAVMPSLAMGPKQRCVPKRASYLFIVSLAWPSRPHWKVASSTRLLGSLQPLSSLPALSVYNRTVCVISGALFTSTFSLNLWACHPNLVWGEPTGTGSMSSSSAYIHRTLQTGGLMEAPKQMTGPAVTTKNTFCVRPEGRCCVCVCRGLLLVG